ncbi:MAG: sulfotransferase [Thiocapsa sp.]|uniref:sulfotransferase family protein n=1 Tax=Thiocapsa sp. TaxID=2024551 RepID=UPI001BCE77AD|nr:sulfotransferase [Thiocapsa sp.]QVL47841.1 MAG: sulfotransferase [Thiocapsa sp.]
MTQDPVALDAWVEQRLDLGHSPWLFILGLNNSGTTLLTRVLEQHPMIRSLPHEGQWLTPALPHPPTFGAARTWSSRADIFHWIETDDPSPARRIRYDWAHYYPDRPGILLEKSPPNTLRSRWLEANFSPSRFIGIVRHPYALCEGAQRRLGVPVDETARHWRNGTGILLDDAEHLRHVVLMRYEDLTAHPAPLLRRLEAFLDVPPASLDETVLGDIKASYIRKESAPLRNMNPESFARLSHADRERIAAICGDLMDRIGYETLPIEGADGLVGGVAPQGHAWLTPAPLRQD